MTLSLAQRMRLARTTAEVASDDSFLLGLEKTRSDDTCIVASKPAICARQTRTLPSRRVRLCQAEFQ